jgi:pyrroloquinoline-quinone synthase
MEISVFWNQVDQEISKYDLLNHPFYQAWSAGELTMQDLKFYAEQYYHQVSNFPTYLTCLHSRLPEGAMRRDVLANAYEEECAACPHSELWLRFVEGMGGSAADTAGKTPIPEVNDLLRTFRSLAQQAPVAAAFGALFAYESQVPRIASEKLSGLKQHYGADDRACGYFTLHQKADVHHSNVWRKIISTLVEQDDRRAKEALEGVSHAARALWTALDGIERVRRSFSANVCAASVN